MSNKIHSKTGGVMNTTKRIGSRTVPDRVRFVTSLTTVAHELLTALAEHGGISMNSVLEGLIREGARSQGLTRTEKDR
jgi:hypothetical protein